MKGRFINNGTFSSSGTLEVRQVTTGGLIAAADPFGEKEPILISPAPVPEPAALVLLAAGACLAAATRRAGIRRRLRL